MLAVCDILGFGDLVTNHPVDYVVTKVMSWFAKALHHSLHHGDFPTAVPTFEKLVSHDKLGFAWFSDTVVLYTREDTQEHYKALCETLGWLLFETMQEPYTRIRCGVSYGEAHIDERNRLYVGPVIVDAYRLEQSQVWSGGAFTKQAEEKLPAPARKGEWYEWYLVPYDVPLKDRHITSSLAVDWTRGLHPPLEIPWSERFRVPSDQDWQLRRDVCEKWRNTDTFHRRMCKRCFRD